MNLKVYLHVFFLVLLFIGVNSMTFTIHNNCPFKVWPAIYTYKGQASTVETGFELAPQNTQDLSMSHDWAGRIWARSFCSGSDSGGTFTCPVGDCRTGRVGCNGALGTPPFTFAEFTLSADNGKDYYDVNLEGGFNLPIRVTPTGSGNCVTIGCPVDINNHGCPTELMLHDSNGGVIGCKSACTAFNRPEFCCTGEYSTPDKCRPTQYSTIFKNLCPQAFTYIYDENSTFVCNPGSNYSIVFCP